MEEPTQKTEETTPQENLVTPVEGEQTKQQEEGVTETFTPESIVSGKPPQKKGVDTTPKWFKDRFDELTRKLYEKDARIKELESKTSTPVPSTRPTPPTPPTMSDYISDEDRTKAMEGYKRQVVEYEDNLDVWRKSQSNTEALKFQRDRELSENIKKFEDRSRRVMEKYPDFHESTQQRFPTPELVTELYASEYGPEIAYYLAKNPAEIDRIAYLNPQQIAKEIGKLEYKFSEAFKKKTSEAPPPLNPIKGDDTVKKKPSDMTDSEWYEHEKQERLRKLKLVK